VEEHEGASMIRFNRPTVTGGEEAYLRAVGERGKFAGGGPFSTRCDRWLTAHFGCPGAFVTTSCTHALEAAAMLCDIQPGDEVILPSFAFPSTATAFVRSGARLVFVDIDPSTMSIDPLAVERAITPNTRVIVALHYGGVACRMDELLRLAEAHFLLVVEDAAQAMFSTFKGRACGTLGALGCISFHESKNLHCGEGGALVCRTEEHARRAEVILEKGTNRTSFFRGEVEKYTWLDIGSSFVLSELNAAFLLAQLEEAQAITADRLHCWDSYRLALLPLAEAGFIDIPSIPDYCEHNGHIFWIKAKDIVERSQLIAYLKERSIQAVFHYIPLHTSPAGQKYGRFSGDDVYTTKEAERLVRLPLYYGFDAAETVAQIVRDYYLR
jgi:dTDP-4-amino-4,6-dideoxygalactose transaminase